MCCNSRRGVICSAALAFLCDLVLGILEIAALLPFHAASVLLLTQSSLYIRGALRVESSSGTA